MFLIVIPLTTAAHAAPPASPLNTRNSQILIVLQFNLSSTLFFQLHLQLIEFKHVLMLHIKPINLSLN
jgi:hypothetical protein